jgi:hypothetical protein
MSESTVPVNSMGASSSSGNEGNIATYDPLLLATKKRVKKKLRNIIGDPKKIKKT